MSHVLQCEQSVQFDDLAVLLLNRFPYAEIKKRKMLLGDTVTLTWNADDHTLDIDAPKERDQDFAPAFSDGYGLNKAFADGVPSGIEREVLEWALSAARRLGGVVRTDSGKELRPHRYMLSDLHVVSAYELEPADVLDIVRVIVKEASAPEGASELPYDVSLPIFADADLRVRVEPLEHVIPALAHVDWVNAGAVSYRVQFVPDEPTVLAGEEPDVAQVKKWREAYLGCSAIAKALWNEVGGFIVDSEGYLVDPADLF